MLSKRVFVLQYSKLYFLLYFCRGFFNFSVLIVIFEQFKILDIYILISVIYNRVVFFCRHHLINNIYIYIYTIITFKNMLSIKSVLIFFCVLIYEKFYSLSLHFYYLDILSFYYSNPIVGNSIQNKGGFFISTSIWDDWPILEVPEEPIPKFKIPLGDRISPEGEWLPPPKKKTPELNFFDRNIDSIAYYTTVTILVVCTINVIIRNYF